MAHFDFFVGDLGEDKIGVGEMAPNLQGLALSWHQQTLKNKLIF